MDKNNKKILTVSFVLAGFLAAYVVSTILEILSASFGFVARYTEMDAVKHGFPVVVGAITFAILQFRPKVNEWAEEVVVEVKKVVWKSKNETFLATVVVCIMLIVSGLILGLLDLVSNYLVQYLIG